MICTYGDQFAKTVDWLELYNKMEIYDTGSIEKHKTSHRRFMYDFNLKEHESPYVQKKLQMFKGILNANNFSL